uniref:Uncharacterized protein n=1 Tax=Anguilla anguilla TaxID=7936 RepID=A0A0E9PAH8_ANGAN
MNERKNDKNCIKEVIFKYVLAALAKKLSKTNYSLLSARFKTRTSSENSNRSSENHRRTNICLV